MATPYIKEKGHTTIKVGDLYSRYPATNRNALYCRYRLKIYCPVTGQCKLESQCGGTVWVSESELSNWYRISSFC